MRLISLSEAAKEIKQACDTAPHTPFFYIVGAGISSPPVPRASEIVQICREKVEREGRTISNVPNSAMDEYSFWFQQAYRQPVERPPFLKSLMENKPLSRANWRLAHLLSDGRIANIVVTPNFDDMLSRALTLLGLSYVLCDHPMTANRIDEESPEIQILHVHGTYRFYDCCNLKGEIEERSYISPLTSRLDTLLSRHSPLVIGYSGWENDVIMQALKRRMTSQRLPRHLYWFCYSRASMETLPLWLRNHSDICFVVPSEDSNPAQAPGQPVLPTAEKSLIEGRSTLHHLPAQSVFDSLLQELEVSSPHLTRDPLGFFASRLRQLLLDEEGEEEDPYFLMHVVDRIERAKNHEEQNTLNAEQKIEGVLDLLRGTNYSEASAAIGALKLQNLPLPHLEKLADAVKSAANDLVSTPEIEIEFYQHLQSLMEEWLRRSAFVAQDPDSVEELQGEVVQ